MKNIIFTLTLIVFWITSFAQNIDSTFIANHTYTDLEKALQNPDDVYSLVLKNQGLTEFPIEI